MRGIPLALGGSASLSVKREEEALCVERLAVFFSLYTAVITVALLKKIAFLLIRMPFWSSYGFVSGETLILANLRSS